MVVSVALAKAVLQECCATTFVPMQRLDADKRQVPMRLAWSVVFRPLEDSGDLCLPLAGNAFRNNDLERPIVAVNTWRKPERDAKAVAGAVRGCGLERTGSKRSE